MMQVGEVPPEASDVMGCDRMASFSNWCRLWLWLSRVLSCYFHSSQWMWTGCDFRAFWCSWICWWSDLATGDIPADELLVQYGQGRGRGSPTWPRPKSAGLSSQKSGSVQPGEQPLPSLFTQSVQVVSVPLVASNAALDGGGVAWTQENSLLTYHLGLYVRSQWFYPVQCKAEKAENQSIL